MKTIFIFKCTNKYIGKSSDFLQLAALFSETLSCCVTAYYVGHDRNLSRQPENNGQNVPCLLDKSEVW